MQSLFEKYPPSAFSDMEPFIAGLESFIKQTSAQQLLGIDVVGTQADAKKKRNSLLMAYHSDKELIKYPRAATIATRAILEAYNKFTVSHFPSQQVSGLQSEDDNISARDSNATPSDLSDALVFASLSDEEKTERYALYTKCIKLFYQLLDQVRGDPLLSTYRKIGQHYLSKCNFGEFGIFNLADNKSTNIFFDWVLNGWLTRENTINMFQPSNIRGRVALSVDDFKQIITFLEFKVAQFKFSKDNGLEDSLPDYSNSRSSAKTRLSQCNSINDFAEVSQLLIKENTQRQQRETMLGTLWNTCESSYNEISRILEEMGLEQNRRNELLNSVSSIASLRDHDITVLQHIDSTLKSELETVKKLQIIHGSCKEYLAKRPCSAYLISCGCGFVVQWMSPLRYCKVLSTLALFNKIRGTEEGFTNIKDIYKHLNILNNDVVGAVEKYKLNHPHAVSSKEDKPTVTEDGEFSKAFKPTLP